MARKPFRDLSKREKALHANAYAAFVAGAHDRVAPVREVPPKRERKPRIGPSEHQLQVAVVDWWRHACKGYGLPEFALFAIPNGGARDVITGSRLKAEGVRKGIPDLMLVVPRVKPLEGRVSTFQFHGMFIEMKRKDGRRSVEQAEVLGYLYRNFYSAVLCRSSEEAISAIKEYLT